MKTGTEDRRKVLIMSALLVVALLSVIRMLSAPEPQVATSAAPGTAGGTTGGRRPGGPPVAPVILSTLDPTLRLDWLRASEDVKYEGKGRNIFRAGPEPQPVDTGQGHPQGNTQPDVPPGPAPPPPINLKYYGFASKPGQPRQAFLSQGEDVFVAGEGDIVNRRYKVVRIGPVSVEVEDLQYNHRQVLPLTQS
ncbi:MAG: hypothetical protein ACRESV_04135 [Nevskiales bacterium]